MSNFKRMEADKQSRFGFKNGVKTLEKVFIVLRNNKAIIVNHFGNSVVSLPYKSDVTKFLNVLNDIESVIQFSNETDSEQFCYDIVSSLQSLGIYAYVVSNAVPNDILKEI